MDKDKFCTDYIKSGKGSYDESLKAWDDYKENRENRIREETVFIQREMGRGSDYREAHAAWVEYKRSEK